MPTQDVIVLARNRRYGKLGALSQSPRTSSVFDAGSAAASWTKQPSRRLRQLRNPRLLPDKGSHASPSRDAPGDDEFRSLDLMPARSRKSPDARPLESLATGLSAG